MIDDVIKVGPLRSEDWAAAGRRTVKGFVSVFENSRGDGSAHCHSKLPLSEMLSVLAEGKRSLWSVGLW